MLHLCPTQTLRQKHKTTKKTRNSFSNNYSIRHSQANNTGNLCAKGGCLFQLYMKFKRETKKHKNANLLE